MGRRDFLLASLGAAAGLTLARRQWLIRAEALTASSPARPATSAGTSRYGPLSATPDENGILLPSGFRSRLIAVGGETVPGTDHQWHPYADGAACFATPDGGWIYVSNSEVFYPSGGGVGAIRFDRRGRIADAYSVLEGTTANCSGGPTPRGTWLSGEEYEQGLVWECDPLGRRKGVARPALGVFPHECAVGHRGTKAVYLSEDRPDGLLYRFRPDRWPSLKRGTLEAASVAPDGTVSWVEVHDPGATAGPARASAPGATPFNGGEGLALYRDQLYLCTKGDDHVRRFDLTTSTVTTVYDGTGLLRGVDNLTVHEATGAAFVCEDLTDMQLVVLEADGSVAPFLRFVDQPTSEVTGPAFDPSGTRLYVSSQRAPTPKALSDVVPGAVDDRNLGRTYEIVGPFG
jgi:hypothetical protein